MADAQIPKEGDRVELYGRIREVTSVTNEHIVFKTGEDQMVMPVKKYLETMNKPNDRQNRVTEF